jgi:hypothetical protein
VKRPEALGNDPTSLSHIRQRTFSQNVQHDHTEGLDIAFRLSFGPRVELPRDVPRCPAGTCLATVDSSQAEIYENSAAFRAVKNVSRFDIVVLDTLATEVFKCRGHIVEDAVSIFVRTAEIVIMAMSQRIKVRRG